MRWSVKLEWVVGSMDAHTKAFERGGKAAANMGNGQQAMEAQGETWWVAGTPTARPEGYAKARRTSSRLKHPSTLKT